MAESIVENIDCMEGMKRYPDKYFDLAIVDPPYGIGEDGKSNHGRGTKKAKATKFAAKDWDKEPAEESYFLGLVRVSKNQILWGANHFLDRIPFSLNSPCWLVWDKHTTGDFADCELAFTSFTTAVRKFYYVWNGYNQGVMGRSTGPMVEDRIHPTQKPIALYKWILKNYAKPGDKILDTHLGSGSSRIAAYDMGFDFTGFEIDPDYFAAQEKRFQQFKAQTKLFA
jgi:site-specific DNA-methyltransferase (adenine-specific)